MYMCLYILIVLFSNQVFDGNWDNNSVRKHFFTMKVLARYVRLWPHSYNNRIAVRWEVYGCPGKVKRMMSACMFLSRMIKTYS